MNLSVTARNIVLLDALGRIIQALHEAGIEPLVLKGAALAETVYPGISMRPMIDADILVREEEIDTVTACVTALGYSSVEDKDCVFCKNDRFPVRLDVHYEIWYLADADFKNLWVDSRPVSIAQSGARTMAPDETLIYTAAHAAIQHGTLGPIALEDISRICSFYRHELDWDKVVKKIKKYSLKVPVYLALSEAGLAKGAPVPGKALDALKPSSVIERFEERIYRSILRAPTAKNIGHLLKMLSQKGIHGKTRFFIEAMFPSRAFIARRYNVSRPAAILGYRFLRPFMQVMELMKLLSRRRSAPAKRDG
jgi:hypothetical protein